MMLALPRGPFGLVMRYLVLSDFHALPLFHTCRRLRAIIGQIQKKKYDNDPFCVFQRLSLSGCQSLSIVQLEWLFTAQKLQQSDAATILRIACRIGAIEAVRWLLRNNFGKYLDDPKFTAARHGHLEILELLRDASAVDKNPWDDWTRSYHVMFYAISGGHLDVVKWLKINHCPFRPRAVVDGVSAGNLDLMRWLIEDERLPYDFGECIRSAAHAGHKHIIMWLHSKNPDKAISDEAMQAAFAGGRLDLIQWLISEHKCRFNIEVASPMQALAICLLASRGHLDVLIWFFENGGRFRHIQVLLYAAGAGQLEVVKWLKDKVDQPNAAVMHAAASNDKLEMVKWLRANGCPWNWEVLKWAMIRKKIQVVKWLIQNGCPTNPEVTLMDYALQCGLFTLMLWLRNNGYCDWTKTTMDIALGNKWHHVTQWMIDNGYNLPLELLSE